MLVVVKFKGEPIPTIMEVHNVSYVKDLGTMPRVEWASAGYFDSHGSFHARKHMSRDSALGDIIIEPNRPAEPRTSIGGDLTPM